MTNSVLTAFGLQDQEAPLCRAFRATGAAIHGGAALSWYLNTEPPSGQDIDIWCQPVEAILKPILYALFDTIFRAAGYLPITATSSTAQKDYAYAMRDAHIDVIHDWKNSDLDRKIQLIFRKSHTREGIPVPASPTGEFDIDVTTVRVAPSLLGDRLISYLPSPELGRQIDRRVLNLHNLKGQKLHKVEQRIRKYYNRGFAFESTEARCACACGATHHVVVTPPHRLSLKEAFAHVRKSWIAANPLSADYKYRADNIKHRFLENYSKKLFLTQGARAISWAMDVCDRGVSLPQNRDIYPAETRWISDFRDILYTMGRIRGLEKMAVEMDERVGDGETGRLMVSFCNDIIRRVNSILENPDLEGFPELIDTVHVIRRRAVQVLSLQDVTSPVPGRKFVKKLVFPSVLDEVIRA